MQTEGAYGNPGSRDGEIAVVRAIYDAFATRDVERALPFLAEDFELHVSGTAERLGRSEPYRGHDGLREYLADADRAWDELTVVADDMRAAAGGVIVFGHVEAVADGVEQMTRALWVWQVRDGLAVSMRVTSLD